MASLGDSTGSGSTPASSVEGNKKGGMILPFQPLTMMIMTLLTRQRCTFKCANSFLGMSSQGIPESKLQLLSKFSGAFFSGGVTALAGSSGAGRTPLMDILAGRKTSGYIEGESGYQINQKSSILLLEFLGMYNRMKYIRPR